MPIRVILVDDHPIVLHGLEQLLARQPDLDVVTTCTGADTALRAVREHHPDVLVVDVRMPERSGLDLLRSLANDQTAVPTVLLTAAIRDDEVAEAVRLGARGLVLKESSPDALLDCIRSVAAGGQCFERDTLARAFSTASARAGSGRTAETLTARELEIVRMVSQGLRNRAIAERLSITEGTVKVHLHNIYEKLGVDGRLELVLCAQEKRLI